MTVLNYCGTGDQRLAEAAEWNGLQSEGLSRHYHDEIQVSIVTEGFRDYVVAGAVHRMERGSVLAIGPGVSHHALPSTFQDVRSIELYIPTGSASANLVEALSSARAVVSNQNAAWEAQSHLDDLLQRIACTGTWQTLMAATTHSRSSNPYQSSPLMRCLEEGLSISDLARELGQARETFSRTFSKQYGINPQEALTNARLNRSRELLRLGEPPGEVAHEAGFSDQSHLGRMFARYFGTTPAKFRAAHRQR